jgi:hypothetical protein
MHRRAFIGLAAGALLVARSASPQKSGKAATLGILTPLLGTFGAGCSPHSRRRVGPARSQKSAFDSSRLRHILEISEAPLTQEACNDQ